MEALILAIIITYAIKKAVQDGSAHWQGSKAASRRGTRGQPVSRRAASAARHDAGYWAHQVAGGFPEARHALVMGWHSGRLAQHEGRQARQQAKTERMTVYARARQAVREQRRRQEEIREELRRHAERMADPPPAEDDEQPDEQDMPPAQWSRTGPVCPRCHAPTATPELCPACRLRDRQPAGTPPAQAGNGTSPQSAPTPTEGSTAMSGDTTYTQQLAELQAIRRDAEQELNSVARKRMISRLDVLMSLGLDSATLSEAAAIDDALREQEKAARQTLDATDAAISGLRQRHGGIQEAVDNSPVAQPAEPEFYQS